MLCDASDVHGKWRCHLVGVERHNVEGERPHPVDDDQDVRLRGGVGLEVRDGRLQGGYAKMSIHGVCTR